MRGKVINNYSINTRIIKENNKGLKPGSLLNSESKKNQVQLNSILNNLPGMVYRCKNDANWTMQYLSKGASQLTGYSIKELVNNNKISFDLLIFPKDRRKVKIGVNDAIKNKKPFEIEYRIIHKSGKVKWVWERGQAILNGENKVIGLEGFIMDVSEKKTHEEELNQKWLDYRELVEQLPVGIILHDEGKIIFCNNEALKIGGLHNKEQLLGRKVFEFLKEPDISIAKTRAEKIKKGFVLPKQHYEIINFKGKKLQILANSSFVLYNGKKVLQISIQDITQQKELEYEKLISKKLKEEINLKEKAQEELLRTQQSLRQIIDSSLDVISASDNGGKIIEFNKAAEKTFGYKKNEVIGKNARLLFLDKSKNPAQIKNELFRKGVFQGEVFNVKRNGQKFLSLLSATVLKDLTGKVIGTMGISRDITEYKKQEKELRENEEKYRVIFNQAFIGIARVSIKDGSFIDVNNHLCSLLGYKEKDLLRMKIFEIFTNEDVKIFSKSLRAFGEEKLITRRSCISKKGKLIEMNISFSIVEGVEYSGQQYIIVAFDDVTELVSQEQKLRNQTAKLTSVFENSTHLVWTLNRKKELTYFNSNFSKVLFECFGVRPILNKRYDSLLSKKQVEAYKTSWEIKYPDVINGKNVFIERIDSSKEGSAIYREVYLNPILNSKGEVVEISGFAQDISERKKSENQIIEQSSKLNAIFESGNLLIWSINKRGELTSFNRNYSNAIVEYYGFTPELGKIPRWGTGKKYKEFQSFWDEKYKLAFKGIEQDFTTERKNLDGTNSYAHFYLHPIYNRNEIVEIAGIGQDISKQKTIELQLIESEAKTKAILQSIPDLIFTISKQGLITNVQAGEVNEKGINKNEYLGRTLDSVFSNTSEIEVEKIISKTLKGVTELSFGYEVELENETRYFELRFAKLNQNECLAISRDITNNKLSEQKIINSLREKEILLKEVHHRVKNNLQVISSILNLQSNYIKDQNTILILKECQSRIKSMAFIHELLYQSKDFNKINFSEYLMILAKNLFHSYNFVENRVRQRFEIDPVFLNLDTSISCGLIVNELISNALKYAFPNNKKGFIFVSLKNVAAGILLKIEDNGVGLPRDLDYKNTESLGLQLVMTLVEQISGEISVSSTNGTKFSILIKSNNL